MIPKVGCGSSACQCEPQAEKLINGQIKDGFVGRVETEALMGGEDSAY